VRPLLLLASNSPRRRQLLTDAGFEFATIAPRVAEKSDVDRALFIHTIENDADSFLNLINPANYAAVNALIQDVNPDFIQWDPLNSLTDNDLNSDMDMRAVVSAISTITRSGNPNRIPFVLHHSLTGKIGAARAVGWDKASYGRNSKVLQAWTRAQINLAPRSADNPNLLIMSCGKNNNGKLFPEIGVEFDENLGIYIKDDSFDPEEFREEVGIQSSKKKPITPEQVADLVEDGIPRTKLLEAVKNKYSVSQPTAYRTIDRAEEAGNIRKERGKK
jgi:hypothetical protein